jgi:hypothetical protein
VFKSKTKARGIRLGRSMVVILLLAIAPFVSLEAAAQRNAIFDTAMNNYGDY